MPSVAASAAIEHLHNICEVQWEADSKWAGIGSVSGFGRGNRNSSSTESLSPSPVVVLPRQVVTLTVHFRLRRSGVSVALSQRALLCELGETSIVKVWKRLFRRVTVVPFFSASTSDGGKDEVQNLEVPVFQPCVYGDGEHGFGCSSYAPRGTRSEAAKGKMNVLYAATASASSRGTSVAPGAGDSATSSPSSKVSRRGEGESVPDIVELVTTIRVRVGIPDNVVAGEKCCVAFSFLLRDATLPLASLLPTPLGYGVRGGMGCGFPQQDGDIQQQQQQQVAPQEQQLQQQQRQLPPTSPAFLLPNASAVADSDPQRRKNNRKSTSSTMLSAFRAMLLQSTSPGAKGISSSTTTTTSGGGLGAVAADGGGSGEVAGSLIVPRGFQCPSVFFGTLYQPVVVVRVLAYEVVSRRVSPSRVLVNVTLTNVSGMRVCVTECRFDLWSTSVGSGCGGSGGGKREHGSLADIPAHAGQRVAPSGNSDVATVQLLSEVVSAVRVSTTSGGVLVLEPLETYSIQYVLQVKPHLCYLSGTANGGDGDVYAASSSAGNASSNGQLSKENELSISRLLALPFVSQLYVYYDPMSQDGSTEQQQQQSSNDLYLSCPVSWTFKN